MTVLALLATVSTVGPRPAVSAADVFASGQQQGEAVAPSGLLAPAQTAGWSLVSLPLLPSSTALDDLIGDQLTGSCDPETADSVLFWDPATGYESAWYCDCDEWGEPFDNHWLTGYSQTSLTLDPDEGMWVQNKSGAAEVFTVVGDVGTSDRVIDIGVGWTLFGTAFPVARALDDAGIPATGTCDPETADVILSWDASTQSYESAWYCDCDEWGEPFDNHWLTGYAQTSIQLAPGSGYWYQNRHTAFTWTYPAP
jgi:hypothetical protein